ncbi:MAG: hypothetical protein DI598_06130 [Pseudopedobacter saltans]|uniref:Lipocalin-like domain-containing protein n=1 Tax=Pseudopedobacter saltans TaxID=151895 RepID=A0A2W5GWI3_9SPHI|nr:MAG: hypothetical protein DI598_06130 [Pseudopedobacter saltans]
MNAKSQISLIGDWRIINKSTSKGRQDTSIHNIGDIQLNADSTFYIFGDTTSSKSQIPGWHVGSPHKGRWTFIKGNPSRLNLYYDAKDQHKFFPYIIDKITKNEMILYFSSLKKYPFNYKKR